MANSFLNNIFGKRDQIQKGVETQQLSQLVNELGYDIVQGKNGELIPMPREIDSGPDISTFSQKWGQISDSSDLLGTRKLRLSNYDKMDVSGGESAVVLDTIRDEIVNVTDYSDTSLCIKINDHVLEKKIYQVLENNGVLGNIGSDIREMCKYGDFAYVFVDQTGNNIVNLDLSTAENGSVLKVPYSHNDIQLIFLKPAYYSLAHSASKVYELELDSGHQNRYQNSVKVSKFMPWEYSLFSIKSRDTFPYGYSQVEKMRQAWEKLAVLEELLAVTRANKLDRIAVSVPGLKGDPSSVMARLSQLKNTIKNIILGNGSQGRVSRNQDTGMTEYLWVPENFKVERLSTSIETNSIEDVEYFQERLFNSSRLPKSFFISDATSQQRPMSLRQQDIKFARSLVPISEAYCVGLHKLIKLIAFYLGADLNKFKCEVAFKKSPYITEELLGVYNGVYDIISRFKDVKGEFGESTPITDVDVKRVLDLINAPHELLFPNEKAEKTTIAESKDSEEVTQTSLLTEAIKDIK